MFFDLKDKIDRDRLIYQIQVDIDKACKEHFADDPRKHLGASIIGHDCTAYGWNTFRHLKQEDFSGQMFRLFNRGHEEEARFIKWLTLAGFQVVEFDPETKKQFRITGANGHFGGSLDALIKPPEHYNFDGFLVWLGEFKTHNEASFAKLAGGKDTRKYDALKLRSGGQGVRKAKPQHFKQMCSYGRAYNLQWGFYCAVNKDTDELYFEIVELDYNQADELFRKAEAIVNSQIQPRKLSLSKTNFECKYCNFAGICFDGELPAKNCRSCVNASAGEKGTWNCALFSAANGPIPDEVIKTGCDSWKAIINAKA